VKPSSTFLILLFWISCWFPTSPDNKSIIVAVCCILGLGAAYLAKKMIGERVWPSWVMLVLACLVLFIGGFLVFRTWIVRTPAEAGITLFMVLGFVGYLLLIGTLLSPRPAVGRHRSKCVAALLILAIWSWTSAIRMHLHIGAGPRTDGACILVPDPADYETKLSSVLHMRLPQITSVRTSWKIGYIWNYHAILVIPVDGGAEHYNWSKKWMRFEILDPVRNPYLPMTCP